VAIEEVYGYRDGTEGQNAADSEEHHEDVDQVALVG
jgi:hypothetical protein